MGAEGLSKHLQQDVFLQAVQPLLAGSPSCGRRGESVGESNSALLPRPQRSQRRLLRLGQAPDTCDIQSLIGAVASQCLHVLGAVQIPDRDGPVIPANGQPAAIGTHLERLDCPLVHTLATGL
jgi:hypothetical protein